MTSSASAALYTWEWTPGTTGGADVGVSNAAGTIKRVDASFNTSTQTLSWYVKIGSVPGHANWSTDGFTLALKNGPNPKGHTGELALLYFDASRSTPVLNAYGYNALNNQSSFWDGRPQAGWQWPGVITSSRTNQSWILDLKNQLNPDGTRTLGFTINADLINKHTPLYPGPNGLADWFGIGFDDSLGVWMHTFAELDTSYALGWLTKWNSCAEGWLDGRDFKTVPEPATLVLLALSAMAVLRRRRSTIG